MTTAYIGLGSNLNNPAEHIFAALREIAQVDGCHLTAVSNTYLSRAVGPGDQPDYVNAVAQIDTTISPLDLLDALQAIEQQHGRVRDIRWGPRTLDLDLLLFGAESIDHPRLTVPHPRAFERDFVLRPLADIDATLGFPDGRRVVDCLTLAMDNDLRPLETSQQLWEKLQG
jgi:2-amino-4-hydroxy-6-hydroxymethyldihydropteridine diphosphokinase